MNRLRTGASRCATVAVVLAALLSAAHGAAPSWWADRGVINPQGADDDYQAANAGQLKNIATAAYQEMEQSLAQLGGAGPGVAAMAQSLVPGDDYAAINQGQLKYVAEPFYDRLIEIGYCSGYPWGTGPQDDWVLMNIGQLKNVFSFDLTLDSDTDGMPDWWEEKHGFNPQSGVDDSLTAWWTFDEGSGTIALDETANNYDGAISGAGFVPGKLGYALEFDGTDDKVTVPQPTAIIGGGTFTVSAWVWLDQQANAQYHPVVSDMQSQAYVGYWLGFDTDYDPDQLEIFWGDGLCDAIGSSGQPAYRDQWAHAVGTCDGTTKTFYLNGQFVGSKDAPAFVPAAMNDLLIGEDIWGYRWKGKIDEIRVYTTALAPGEIATMYDAVSDGDNDGLSCLEEFQAGTDPYLVDTDLDGLDDGDEVDVYLTDPTNPDTDDDGLGDGEEVNTYGTGPLDPDSDDDWALDGFEVQEGTGPTLASETPHLEMLVNDGAYYATSQDLVLDFPGLAADSVVVYELYMLRGGEDEPCVELSEGVNCDDPENGVIYGLRGNPQPAEDGEHHIEIRAVRGEQMGPVFTSLVVLDTQAPTLTVTSPLNDSTTHARWIRVAGEANDEIGPVRIFVNGEWADGVAADGFFWYDRFPLVEGDNTIVFVAEDMAGHIVEQEVVVDQDLDTDEDPPELIPDYPQGITPVADVETLALHGTIDDPTALVNFTVTSEDEVTSGPFLANVIDGRFWGRIPLSPGENDVAIIGVDASGNQGAQQFTIHRTWTPGVTFEIASPLPEVLIRDMETKVSVIASEDEFSNAVVEVNGVPTHILGINNGLVTFETVSPVSLESFLTPLEAKATDPETGDWYHKLTAQGYEIFSYGATNKQTHCSALIDDYPDPYWHTYWASPQETHTHWTPEERPENHHMRSYEESESCEIDESCVSITGLQYEEDTLVKDPPSEALFEDVVVLRNWSDWSNQQPGIHIEFWNSRHTSDARYTFRKYVDGVDKQLIVLHFHDMDYDGSDELPDPSQIIFRGEPGFAYGENSVGFLQEIMIGATHSISKADFAWPSFSDRDDPDIDERGRRLRFDGWGNEEPVRIYRDGRNITGTRGSVWAGERLNLQVKLTVVPDSLVWDLSGNHIKNWQPTEPASTEVYLSDSDLRETSISFAWRDDKTRPAVVECRVQLEGIEGDVRVAAEFDVNKIPRSVTVANNGQVRFWTPPGSSFGLHYGSSLGGTGPGVSFDTSDTSRGQLCWVQIGDVTRRWTLDSGEVEVREGVALDDVEYLSYFSDSPGNYISSNYSRIEVDDDYETHLMFKPASTLSGRRPNQGIWVPLKRYTWGWDADVTRDDELFPGNGGWPTGPLPQPAAPTGGDSDTYPSWKNTFVH